MRQSINPIMNNNIPRILNDNIISGFICNVDIDGVVLSTISLIAGDT